MARATTITGEPVLDLTFTCTQPNPAVFAYLELVDPDGEVHYLTEGLHQATSRPGETISARIELLPTSVTVPSGWRVQLGLAGTDADTFPVSIPDGTEWTIDCGSSRLALPVEP